MELKAGGGLIDSHFTENNCETKSFNLPLGLGELNWDGIACSLNAGTVKIGFHVALALSLPPALATSDITLNSGDQNAGESYSSDKVRATSSCSVRGENQIMQELVTNGPMYVAFTVYGDFPTYKSGVYKHTSGSYLGGHAVTLLGFGELDG